MEVDFPRGSAPRKSAQESDLKKPVRRKRDKNLFMSEEFKPNVKKRKLTKKYGLKGKSEIEGTVDSLRLRIHLLTYKTICQGTIAMGVITKIQDFSLIVSLTNNIKGTVSITDISDAYTKKLEQLAEGTITEDEGVHSLSEMYKVGMLVCCKVTESRFDDSKNIHVIDLSMNPKFLCEGRAAKFLKNDMKIYASVESKEDHGYILDIGVPNTKGFLSNNNAKEYIESRNEGDSLMIGQVLWCCVQLQPDQDLSTSQNHTIKLTIAPTKLASATVESDDTVSYNNLLPGVITTAVVKKSNEYGIVASVGNMDCLIHPTHLNGNPIDFKEDQEIEVTVLYVHPETKSIYLTTLPHLMNYNGFSTLAMLGKLSIGDIVEDAIVCEANKQGVYLKLPRKMTGFALSGNLSDTPVTQIKETFPVDSKQRCRVIGINGIDNFVMLSLKKSVIDEPYLNMTDLVPGQLVTGEVMYVKDTAIGVKLGSLKAVIPQLHIADVPLKNPSKKFSEGDMLQCRVLHIDHKQDKILLTNKKSLIKSKLPIVTDMSELQVNLMLDGCIAFMNEKGVLFVTFNDIKGWVPLSQLSEETVTRPDKMFYVGQVVRCRVMRINEETNQITFSMRKGKPTVKAPVEKPEGFEAGKIESCKIRSKLRNSFKVVLTSTGKEAFLNKSHLSDFEELSEILWKHLEEGSEIDHVMHFSYGSKIILTMKKSLMNQIEEGDILTDISQLSVTMLLPAVVTNVTEFGIFFTLTGGLSGLVPLNISSDDHQPLEELEKHMSRGKSIVVKVVDINMENKTFTASMLSYHCFSSHENRSTVLMQLFLESKEMADNVLRKTASLKDLMSKMEEVPVGSVVSAIVQDISEDGVMCSMANGLSAAISTDLLYDCTPTIGEKVLGIVLSHNIARHQLELSLDPTVITALKESATESQVLQLNVDKKICAEVVQVHPSYYLLSLKNKALGCMAYLPVKQTINSITVEDDYYPVKKKLKVIIYNVYKESFIASTKRVIKDRPQPLLYVDAVYKATITKIHPFHMDLDIEGNRGSLHCTNMVDVIETNGFVPFAEYTNGEKLDVKVIMNKKIPDSDEYIAECSIKPSHLSRRMKKRSRNYPMHSEQIVFMEKVEKENMIVSMTAERKGVIPIFDLSDDFNVLENIQNYFKPGTGYNVKVAGQIHRCKIVFTLLENREKVSEGEMTKGFITAIDKDAQKLTVMLPMTYTSTVVVKKKIDKFRTGQWLWCAVNKVDKTNHTCEITIKNSRD